MNSKIKRHSVTHFPIILVLSLALLCSCSSSTESTAPSSDTEQSLQLGLDAYNAHDYDHAFAILQPLAQAGNSEAQRHLGVMYRHGLGVAHNDLQAIKWYRAAAEQGHVRAQNNLGIMYMFGMGTAPDVKEAEHWLLAAAKQNDAKAEENLGLFYTQQQKFEQAAHYLSLAADQNQQRAQLNLGLLLLAGNGVEKDETSAMKWISKAAQSGSAPAAQALARAYQEGLYGYPVDQAQARFWAARAGGQ